jgi:uncharacterized membrane protein YdbT with pleckstrin-like domain
MGYIKQTLSDGEEQVASFNLNIYMYLGVYFQIAFSFLIILSGGYFEETVLELTSSFSQIGDIPDGFILKIFLFIGGILLIKGIYQYFLFKSLDMGITDKRVVFKKGIVGRHTDEIRLNAVETVEVEQSIFGRLFGYGTVKVTGRGDSVLKFVDIDQPIEVKKAIASVINNYSRS